MPQFNAGTPLRSPPTIAPIFTQLATGKVSAIDNQIDTTTGTVKVRAQFDNADNALFPNQFVNARLLVKRCKTPSRCRPRRSSAARPAPMSMSSTPTTRSSVRHDHDRRGRRQHDGRHFRSCSRRARRHRRHRPACATGCMSSSLPTATEALNAARRRGGSAGRGGGQGQGQGQDRAAQDSGQRSDSPAPLANHGSRQPPPPAASQRHTAGSQ